jgi:RNA polymerase sigma-70 factor (ECF subfamily)
MESIVPVGLPRFEVLIEQHHGEIHAYLWRLLAGAGDFDQAADAHDLVQDVFERAYRAYPRLKEDSNPRAWLYRIATNCFYTLLKRRRFHSLLPDEDEPGELPDNNALSPDDQAEQGEALALLWPAIASLPPRQKAALWMRYVQELEYEEIAEIMNSSMDTVRANVYQAIQHLRRSLRYVE